ncbi:hypothetical protein PY310_07430 [Pseudarthrobacter sp. H3Y2-7]|uniref:hypothetical protein n=1 Tax=Pseudarthrobacter naphthalenicus TaxID=3031328 RepID=UPI0023B09926|nr:hypothetical protein [Pseudarthrobacter sp. H3Y2-7]MDE8668412.1 hypothetical protein [Pseudarthrobacter sp. H3Y2-7]
MVDWESAGRQSDLKLWRAMFWVHIAFILLALVGELLLISGADSETSVWVFVPGIATLIMLTILLPTSYKRWRESRPNEKA